MNRRSFLNRITLGVAVIVVTPKIILAIKSAEKKIMTTEGVIPYIAEQGRLNYTVHKLQGRSLIEQMEPYMNEIQKNWFKMQVHLNKFKP